MRFVVDLIVSMETWLEFQIRLKKYIISLTIEISFIGTLTELIKYRRKVRIYINYLFILYRF